MRQVVDLHPRFGSVPIEGIEIDPLSRDDVPAILKGLQLIWCNEGTRQELFALLEAHFRPGVDRGVGRPGMDIWRIVVLAVLKQGLGCDFDRLHELANQHRTVREMLGHGDNAFDDFRYGRRLIMDNVALLSPELLREINRLVVGTGHAVSKKKPGGRLAARCDSFVVETNVHWPTDVNLLWDAVRCLVRETRRACVGHGIGGWRQHRHLTAKARRLFGAVSTARRWKARPEAVAKYIGFCGSLADRAEVSLARLAGAGADEAGTASIRHFLRHARRQIDQIDRRLLQGEVIPHGEKVFSVFEEHTRWVCKGKAGRPAELGVPVAVVEDEFQFILDHMILWRGGDIDAAVPLVRDCLERFPDLRVCSFDRGFHSPGNRELLEAMLDTAALPRKGKPSAAERAREAEPAFAKARRQHPAVESAINNLEQRGLDRVRTKGAAGFERTVALSVLAANLHRIGLVLQRRERRRIELQRRNGRQVGPPPERRAA